LNLNETKAILKDIALLDNRKLDEAVAMAWHAVIGHLNFDVAKQALILARQDASIGYLEPKHIIVWGKEASHRLQRDQPSQEPEVGTPEPICRAHNLGINQCKACTRAITAKATEWNMFQTPTKANKFEDRMWAYSKRLHAWAIENIYA